jgi:hypothetical protein
MQNALNSRYIRKIMIAVSTTIKKSKNIPTTPQIITVKKYDTNLKIKIKSNQNQN